MTLIGVQFAHAAHAPQLGSFNYVTNCILINARTFSLQNVVTLVQHHVMSHDRVDEILAPCNTYM